MKQTFITGAAVLALSTGMANAQELTIFGPWMGAESDSFNALVQAFTDETGIDASYVGSDSFEQQIVIDLEAGSAANIASFPQPGLAANMAARGFLTPLGDDARNKLLSDYAAGQSWIDLGTYAGPDGNTDFYGIPFNNNVKSLVWYVPENFDDAGYEVPTTMEELKALTQQIVDDGGVPWCLALGSQAATGWPATDWVEDLMLRTQPPEVYDQWVKNEIPFNDPRVINAIEEFGWFAKNDAFVAGGSSAVATIDFRDSPKGLFTSPPQCYMHRQASFITNYFPEGTVVGEDADFFYFPAYEGEDLGQPVLGAGTTIAISNDSPEAHKFIEFLMTPKANEILMARGGFLTPLKNVDPAKFADPAQRRLNDVLLNATTFRFDGSDLMPGAVGAGTFWTGMVDYVGGKDAETVTTEIQDSWDAIK